MRQEKKELQLMMRKSRMEGELIDWRFGRQLCRHEVYVGSNICALMFKEYNFVVEIKGTNDMEDKKALTPHEIARILCAVKHFRSLGIEAYYKAPIRDYETFKAQATQTINNNGNI